MMNINKKILIYTLITKTKLIENISVYNLKFIKLKKYDWHNRLLIYLFTID